MPAKPKTCPNPHCKKPTAVRVSMYQVWRVCCEGCGMEGPMALDRTTRAEAVHLWNSLPRHSVETNDLLERVKKLQEELDQIFEEIAERMNHGR